MNAVNARPIALQAFLDFLQENPEGHSLSYFADKYRVRLVDVMFFKDEAYSIAGVER